VKRTFKDLLPRSKSLRKRLGAILTGGTITGVGLVPTAPALGETSAPAIDPVAVTIANKSQKTQRLILKMPNGSAYRMLLHKSHSSHASHASHASHYSGSSGGSTASPRVTTPPASPPRTVAEQPPALADLAPKSFTGTIDAINREARTITIKQTDSTSKFVMSYRDDTNLRSLEGSQSRLDEAAERNGGTIPLEKGQKVRVSWKPGSTSGKYIAVTIARIP
jgi:hypothetical protein